jgi:hypothetical protein
VTVTLLHPVQPTAHDWRDNTACTPDIAFAFDDDQPFEVNEIAARICATCPVARECEDDAYATQAIGVRAGQLFTTIKGEWAIASPSYAAHRRVKMAV